MNHSFSRRRPSGFTLIELLTVIAIIGVLAGIIIAVVGNVRRNAQESQSLANLRQMGTAVQLYAADRRGALPVWQNFTGGIETPWWKTILPYLGDHKEVFHDPAHAEYDPSSDETLHTNFSYGWNYEVMGRNIGEQDRDDHILTMLSMPNPSKTLMISISSATESYSFISYNSNPEWGKMPDPNRYNGKAPSLFLDGHVEVRPVDEFRTREPWFVFIKEVPVKRQ